uniref:Uncharacterized protein n=1 Tax=Wuchereria bancrofti TaxID=6293 RepID=A0AAF5PY27_WUCBA
MFCNIRRLLKRALELNKTSGCSSLRVMEIEIICFYFLLKFAVKLIGKKAEIPVNNFINCYIIFNNVVLLTHIVRKLLFKLIKTKRIRTVTPVHY